MNRQNYGDSWSGRQTLQESADKKPSDDATTPWSRIPSSLHHVTADWFLHFEIFEVYIHACRSKSWMADSWQVRLKMILSVTPSACHTPPSRLNTVAKAWVTVNRQRAAKTLNDRLDAEIPNCSWKKLIWKLIQMTKLHCRSGKSESCMLWPKLYEITRCHLESHEKAATSPKSHNILKSPCFLGNFGSQGSINLRYMMTNYYSYLYILICIPVRPLGQRWGAYCNICSYTCFY